MIETISIATVSCNTLIIDGNPIWTEDGFQYKILAETSSLSSWVKEEMPVGTALKLIAGCAPIEFISNLDIDTRSIKKYLYYKSKEGEVFIWGTLSSWDELSQKFITE
jgi:hypothetical protein